MLKPTEKLLDVETAERLLAAAREKLWEAQCAHNTEQEQLKEAKVVLKTCSTAEVESAMENRRPLIERGFIIYGLLIDAQIEVVNAEKNFEIACKAIEERPEKGKTASTLLCSGFLLMLWFCVISIVARLDARAKVDAEQDKDQMSGHAL